MLAHPDAVYLAHSPIDRADAPFATYRELAYRTLAALEVPLPDAGTILLKPNATVLYPPEKRVITHPGFVGGLLDALRDRGVSAERMVVADGQSGENPTAGHTWELCGYRTMTEARGVRLAEMNTDEDSRVVEVADGAVYERYPLYREVTDCAFFLNVPLAKCHNLGCTTLSIKNLMGIIAKPERHLCVIQEVDKPYAEDLWRLTESGFSLFEDRFYHKLCDLLVALRGLGDAAAFSSRWPCRPRRHGVQRRGQLPPRLGCGRRQRSTCRCSRHLPDGPQSTGHPLPAIRPRPRPRDY